MAKNKTEVKLTYNDDMLYVLVKCYDEGKRIVQSLQRDSDNAQWDSDSFTISLDPINEKQSGYMFGLNAGGAEVEGSMLVEGSQTRYTETWDERWFSSVVQYGDYWLAEIGIPFTSLRYNKDNLEWGINFIRGDKIENAYYTWTPFPSNFNGIDINYMGTLEWKEIPDVKRKTVFIKPYATASSFKDNSADDKSTETDFDAGVDVRIGITKSLNADITYNPDFSNADVDQEVTNITRFDISLLERREFFIENGDIFSNFGSYGVKPFFSRRIGLKDGQNVPIIYGARVTGNITNSTRLGVMNVQTNDEGDVDVDVDVQNYTVAAFNQKVFKRSQLKGLFKNRKESGNDTINDYNRNYGAEFTYISEKGNFNNNVKFHSTVTDEGEKGNFYGIEGNYITRRLGTGWTLETIDKNYNAELGFVPRQYSYNADTDETVKSGYFFVNPPSLRVENNRINKHLRLTNQIALLIVSQAKFGDKIIEDNTIEVKISDPFAEALVFWEQGIGGPKTLNINNNLIICEGAKVGIDFFKPQWNPFLGTESGAVNITNNRIEMSPTQGSPLTVNTAIWVDVLRNEETTNMCISNNTIGGSADYGIYINQSGPVNEVQGIITNNVISDNDMSNFFYLKSIDVFFSENTANNIYCGMGIVVDNGENNIFKGGCQRFDCIN